MHARPAATARTRSSGAGPRPIVPGGTPAAPGAPAVRRLSAVQPVELGAGVVVGGARVPVVAPIRRGAEISYVSARQAGGGADPAVLARLRADTAGALVVAVENPSQITPGAGIADAALIDVVAAGDPGRAIGSEPATPSIPLLLRGDWSPSEWEGVVTAARQAGRAELVVVQQARRDGALDLAVTGEIRERTGVPVVVDLTGVERLAGAAVAAGADGLWLGPDVAGAEVAAAIETAATLAPAVRPGTPEDLPGLRTAIDGVDAALAGLLERRVELAGRVQALKPVGGHAGRNPEREAEIVHAMAHRVPSLDRAQLATIMDAVITAGLDVAERARPADPPVWRL